MYKTTKKEKMEFINFDTSKNILKNNLYKQIKLFKIILIFSYLYYTKKNKKYIKSKILKYYNKYIYNKKRSLLSF